MSYAIDARPDAPDDWAAFARRVGSFYHEPAWGAALRDAFGFRVTYITARDATGTLAGILPLAETRSLTGVRRLVSLPFSYAAGPVARDAHADAALVAAARAVAAERGVGRLELKRDAAAAPLSEGLVRLSRYATYRLDTRGGEDAVWKRLHAGSTRRSIRKADRDGVRAERADDAAGWGVIARLQSATSHRHGLPAPPSTFFTVQCRALQAAGLADLYVARDADGDALGAVVLWRGARSWIYAFGATRPDALERRPTHALLWRAVRDAIAAGVGFDFGRAAPEQEGLVQFKERWGGVAHALAYDYWPAPSGPNVAARDRGALAWANRLWSALPAPVAARGAFLYKYLA